MEHKKSRKYEARHAAPPESRFSLKQRLTAAALTLVSATAVTAGMHQRNEENRRQHMAVAEKYIASNIDAKTPSISPDYTLILPYTIQEGTLVSENWATPNEKELKEKGQWCNTPEVPLYRYANPEQMETAAEMEMGLSVSAYEAIASEIQEAGDRSEVEAIVQGVYATLGVEATFNKTRSYFETKDEPALVENGDEDGLREFSQSMSEQLKGLTYIPKEMAELPATIDFIDTDYLTKVEIVDGKEVRTGIDGLYRLEPNQIIIRVGSEAWVTVHEYAHAVHHKACPGIFNDGEMTAAHASLSDEVRSNERANTLREDWPKNEDGGYKRYFEAYRDLTGFPTDYSFSAQYEFVADETAALLMKGQVNIYSSDVDSEQVALLQQMVVERLTDALPDVDFRSLIAARAEANEQVKNYDVPLQALIANRVSNVDRTFLSTYGKIVSGDTVEPAIKLMSRNGEAQNYIFCKKSDLRKTAEGDLGGEYSIMLNKTDDTQFDKAVLDMSLKYLRDLEQQKGIDLEYEVRQFDDNVYVRASLAGSDMVSASSDIRYIDMTHNATS
jgi:hypothetical protein